MWWGGGGGEKGDDDLAELRELRDQFEQQETLLGQLKGALKTNEEKLQNKEREVKDIASRLSKSKLHDKDAAFKQTERQLSSQKEVESTPSIPIPKTGKRTNKIQRLKEELESAKEKEREMLAGQRSLVERVKNLQRELDERDKQLRDLDILSVSGCTSVRTLSPLSSPYVMSPDSGSPIASGAVTPLGSSFEDVFKELGHGPSEDDRILTLNEKIINLERKIMDLEEDLKAKDELVRAKTEAVSAISADLNAKGNSMSEELKAAKNEMKLMQENFAKAEAEWKRTQLNVTAENESLAERLKFAEERCSRAEISNSELSAKNASFQQKISSLESELAETKANARDERAGLQRSLKEANNHLEESRDRLKVSNDDRDLKMAEFIAEIKKIVDKDDSEKSLLETIAELETKILDLEEEKGNLQLRLVDFEDQSYSSCKSELQSLKERSRNQDEDLTLLNRTLDDLKVEKTDLEQELLKKEFEISRLSDRISDLMNSNQTLSSAKVTSEMRALELEEMKDKWDDERRELKSLNERLRIEFQEPFDSLKVEFESVQASLNQLEETHSQCTTRRMQCDREIIEKSRKIEQLQIQMAQLERSLLSRAIEVTDVISEQKSKDVEITNLREQVRTLSDKVEKSGLEIELKRVYLNLEATEEVIRGLNRDVMEKYQVISTLRDSISDLRKERDKLQNEMKWNHERLEGLERDSEQKEVTIKELHNIFEQKEYKIIELSDVSEQKDNEIKELSDISEKKDAMIKELSDVSEQKDNEIKELSDISEKKDAMIKELSDVSEQKDNKIKELSDISEKKDAMIKELSDVSEQKDNKIEELSDISEKKDAMIKELNDVSEQKDVMIKELNDVSGKKDAMIKELNDVSEQKDNKIKELSEQKDDKIKELIDASKQKDMKIKELMGDFEYNGTKASEWANLSGEKDNKIQELTIVSEQKDAKIRELTNLSEQKDHKIQELIQISEQKEYKIQEVTNVSRQAVSNQMQELEESSRRKDDKIRELTQNLVEISVRIRELDCRREADESKIRELTGKLDQVAESPERNEFVSHLKESILDQQNIISSIKSEVESKQHVISNLESRIRELTYENVQIETLTQKLNSLQSNYDSLLHSGHKDVDLIKEKDKLKAKNDQLIEKVKKLLAKCKQQERILKEHEVKIEELCRELANSKESESEFEEKWKFELSEKQILQGKTLDLEGQNIDLKNSVQDLTKAQVDLKDQVQELRISKSQLASQLEEAQKALKAKLESNLVSQMMDNPLLRVESEQDDEGWETNLEEPLESTPNKSEVSPQQDSTTSLSLKPEKEADIEDGWGDDTWGGWADTEDHYQLGENLKLQEEEEREDKKEVLQDASQNLELELSNYKAELEKEKKKFDLEKEKFSEEEEALYDQINQLEAALVEKKIKEEELSKELKDKDKELMAFKKNNSVQTFEAKIQSLTWKATEYRETIDKLNSEISDLNEYLENKSNLQMQYDESIREVESLKLEKNQLQEQLQDKQKELESLQLKNSEMDQVSITLQDENSKTKETIANLQQQLQAQLEEGKPSTNEALYDQINQLEATLVEKKIKEEELIKELKDKDEELLDFKKNNSAQTFETKIQSLTWEAMEYRETIEKLNSEISSLNEYLENGSILQKKNDEEIKALKAERDSLQDQLDSHCRDLESLEADLQQKNSEVDWLNVQLQNVFDNGSETKKTMLSEIEALQQNILTLTEKEEKTVAQMEALKAEVWSLTQERDQLQQQIWDNNKLTGSQNKRIEELESSEKVHVQSLREEIDCKCRELECLNSRISSLEASLDAKTVECISLNTRLATQQTSQSFPPDVTQYQVAQPDVAHQAIAQPDVMPSSQLIDLVQTSASASWFDEPQPLEETYIEKSETAPVSSSSDQILSLESAINSLQEANNQAHRDKNELENKVQTLEAQIKEFKKIVENNEAERATLLNTLPALQEKKKEEINEPIVKSEAFSAASYFDNLGKEDGANEESQAFATAEPAMKVESTTELTAAPMAEAVTEVTTFAGDAEWYQQQLATYQEAVAQWQEWAQVKTNEIEQYTQAYANASQELASLQAELESTTECYQLEKETLSSEIKNKKQQEEQLKAKVRAKEIEIGDLLETMERLKSEKEDLSEEIKDLIKDNESLKVAQEESTSNVIEMALYEELKAQLDEASEKRQKLSSELELTMAKCLQVTNERDQQTATIRRLQEQISTCEVTIDSLKKEVEEDQEKEELKTQFEEILREKQKLNSELEVTRSNYDQLVKEKDQNLISLQTLQERVSSSQSTIEKLQETNKGDAQSQIQVESLKQELEKVQNEKDNELERLKANLETANGALAEWNEWGQTKTQEYDTLLQAYNQYLEAYNGLNEELRLLKEKLNTGEEKCDSETVLAFKDEIKSLQTSNTKLAEELNAVKVKNGKLTMKSKLLMKEVEGNKKTFSNNDIPGELGALKVQVKDLNVVIDTLKNERDSLSQRLVDLQDQVDHLSQENQVLQNIKAEYDSLKMKADYFTSEKEEEDSEQLEYANFQALNQNLQAEIQSLKNYIQQQQTAYDNLQQQSFLLEDNPNKLIQLETELKFKDEALKSLEVELEKLKNTELVDERLTLELDKSMKENRILANQMSDWKQQLMSEEDEESALKHMEESPEALRSQLEHACRSVTALQVRVEELTLEVTKLLEERDTLQLKLSNVMRQYERHRESSSRASTACSTPIPWMETSVIEVKELRAKIEELGKLNYALDIELQKEREAREKLKVKLRPSSTASSPPPISPHHSSETGQVLHL